MLDWGNLEYFISCANHGTLSGCAKEMGVNHSTVSRKIEKLEKELEIPVLNAGRVALKTLESMLSMGLKHSEIAYPYPVKLNSKKKTYLKKNKLIK